MKISEFMEEFAKVFLEDGDIDVKLPQVNDDDPENPHFYYANVSYVIVEDLDGKKVAMIY